MRKWVGRLLWTTGTALLLAALAAYLALRGSLPRLDGEVALPGLSAPVRIQRDALGVVTVDAADPADAMRALGYVHAQERYFEMDLLRRTAAGELSELFGPAALELDRQNRVHRLRSRLRANLGTAVGDQEAALRAYRDGVNAGLDALPVRPWPYLLLRQVPRRWALDDSLLAAMAMYGDLQDNRNRGELALARIRAVVPPALYALIAHDGSEWDAPLFGPARGNAALPDAATLDLRTLGGARPPAAASALTPPPAGQAVPLSPAKRERDVGGPPAAADGFPGSNNFAVDGTLTADGRAIVADDMHLGLRAPNLWFRARLRYADAAAPGGRVDVTGFTLPGLPAVIVGSNGYVAWGFTNSYIDTADFARIPPATPGHPQPLTTHVEILRVAGAADVAFPVRESAWGPVLHTEPDGSLLALRWAAQLPGALRLDFAGMSRAGDLEAALAVADRSGLPVQNLVLADRSGRIAWRLIGARPARGPGCTPAGIVTLAADATSGPACVPWPVRSDQAPALVDPPLHRLWTANNRVVDDARLATLGNAGYDLGARARQIRDDLFARQRFTEQDLLGIQLDDRALLLERWWTLLRQVVAASDDPALRPLERATRRWDARAAPDSASYRIVRAFRDHTLDVLQAGLLAPARDALGADPPAPPRAQFEGVAWPLLSARPAHLLPPPYPSWEALLASVAREVQQQLAGPGGDLGRRTWGERNTAAICHPLARALPAIARPWLCMPADALPGDRDMPRVQGPAFGASERMVVSPGHEQDGIVHMPGGQSGHPLSPFWGAGHADWVQGRPTPFLPMAPHAASALSAACGGGVDTGRRRGSLAPPVLAHAPALECDHARPASTARCPRRTPHGHEHHPTPTRFFSRNLTRGTRHWAPSSTWCRSRRVAPPLPHRWNSACPSLPEPYPPPCHWPLPPPWPHPAHAPRRRSGRRPARPRSRPARTCSRRSIACPRTPGRRRCAWPRANSRSRGWSRSSATAYTCAVPARAPCCTWPTACSSHCSWSAITRTSSRIASSTMSRSST